jgi:hypothetical protein
VRCSAAGEGKPRMLDEKETTVYKRALDVEYKLKLKASRAVFSEISKKAPTMPFTVRCALQHLLHCVCNVRLLQPFTVRCVLQHLLHCVWNVCLLQLLHHQVGCAAARRNAVTITS